MTGKSNYGCSQTRLYAVSRRMAGGLALKKWRKFSALKPMYRSMYVAAILLRIDNAEAITNAKLRIER